jgi:hypothetical protein
LSIDSVLNVAVSSARANRYGLGEVPVSVTHHRLDSTVARV